MPSPANLITAATAAATATTTGTRSSDPSQSTIQIAVLDRVIAKDRVSKIALPDYDGTDFNKFEDNVYTELVNLSG
jgi:hypothetical protein